VIYTSGSTGRPKGVEIGHTALANFLTSMGERIGPFSCVLAHTSISFDICGLELYLPLYLGKQMLLAGSDDKRDPLALARLVSSGVDLVQATPTTYRTLVDVDFDPPHGVSLLCGGEPWSMALKDTLCRWSTKVWNTYGPTEATIWCTAHRVHAEDDAIYLGEPLANTTLHVLDDARRPVRDGEEGELCIGGPLLAEGYWQRPALTAEKFFERSPGERVYATGDKVVRTGDKLMFRGRIDDQVKVRGHRVELGEIEIQLCEHVEVSAAAVLLDNDRLVAFVRRRPGAALSHQVLRHHLAQMLPGYMLPNVFHIVDALPLLPSGKIDRTALKTTRV
jgi:amino acid adenylation domain-containing protein